MALVTLDEIKVALDIDPTDTRQDDLLTGAIDAASTAIINYTERDFGSIQVDEERLFEYDGSGYLDIDDATAVSAVALVVPHSDDVVLSADEWTAMPIRRADSPVFYYIIVPTVYPSAASPEIGFVRNLDNYVREHGRPVLPQIAKVTGTWGWPDVPSDVKLATIWTIKDWTSSPDEEENLQAESIAGFSRSWATAIGGGVLAIPNRSRDILAAYQRVRA